MPLLEVLAGPLDYHDTGGPGPVLIFTGGLLMNVQNDWGGTQVLAWAREDKVMPVAHSRRLAELFPSGRLVEIDDSYTLLTQDQPAVLAAAIRPFLEET